MEASTSQVIDMGAQPMDCAFHPTSNLLAAGLITGRLRLYECQADVATPTLSVKAHKDSCRAVRFSTTGSHLLTGSGDLSILVYDLATETPLARLKDAHKDAVNRIACLDEWRFASGDDGGCIKLWDMRQKEATAQLDVHTDFISDLKDHPTEQCLIAVSGDGTLSISDLRTGKVRSRSEEDADDEYLTATVLKNGKKVVCGTSLGVLSIFSWGHFKDCSDRFPGHPSSVDAAVKMDEDTMITGAGDGVIRVLSIQPHSLLGILGQQPDGGCERLALSTDHSLLASVSYDSTVHLWDTSILVEADGEGDEQLVAETTQPAEEASSDEEEPPKKKAKKKGRKKTTKIRGGDAKKSSSFFADIL